ncbi:hypothetical protein CRUP_000017 [Coryphaenoides rupestris]|nr:hypothetical protein CRUP_000017 [Coryphaenoides rupestris]
MSAADNSDADSKLVSVIQKVEESVLSEEKRLTVRGPSPDAPATCLPARVREILTKNLSESSAGGTMSSVMSLQEENRVLQAELGRQDDLLAHSRADRDELAIKYNAISERLEQALCFDMGGSGDGAVGSVAQQNVDLRRRLDEEQAAYKRKLAAYQEGQQRQAQLVQKLQAKVLQYKKKCGDLEHTLQERETEQQQRSCDNGSGRQDNENSSSLEDALIRLEEEHQRSSSLSAVNAMLREQLEQAGLANEALSQDIRRLTADWTKAREELELKESDWRREEESFHSYFSSEHSRLLMLWRQVVGFRRHVCELKSNTERDLSDMRDEMSRASHSVAGSCAGLSSTTCTGARTARLWPWRRDGALLEPASERQLRERLAEVTDLQGRTEQLNARNRLKAQIEEKDRDMAALSRRLEEQRGHSDMQALRTQTQPLAIVSEGESSSEADQDNSGEPLLSLLPGILCSPLHEARGRLSSAQASVQQLRRQLADGESCRKDLELRNQALLGERDAAQRERETMQRERDRLRLERDTLASGKGNLEMVAQAAQSSTHVLQMEYEKLQLSVTEKRDHEREEREAALQERDRAKAEIHRIQRQLEQSESRGSAQRGELSSVREAGQQGEVERQLLEGEKAQLSEALTRTECKNAELSLTLHKLQSEEAGLRDSLSKMSHMNEGLAQDKADLNAIIMQLEEDKALLQSQKREAEQEKLTLRDELVRLEQGRLEVDSARGALQRTLQDMELGRAAADAELHGLRGERLKLQDKLTQLCGEVSALGSELSLARGEGQRQEVALEEVGRGRADLARERAALVVQLTASERENAMLSEELTAFRSEREALETSLFEVQQQLTQLESRREQLETENQNVRLRCEAVTVELRRARSEGETALAQSERDRQTLVQALDTTQREAQQAARSNLSDHGRRWSDWPRKRSHCGGGVAAPQEALRHSLQTECEEVLQKQRQEAEEQLLRAEREQEELREEARSLQRDGT